MAAWVGCTTTRRASGLTIVVRLQLDSVVFRAAVLVNVEFTQGLIRKTPRTCGTTNTALQAWGRSDVFCCCIDDDNSTCFDDQDTVVTYSISTLVLFTSTRTLAVSASAVTETVHLTHRVSDGCPRTTRRGSLTSPGSGFMLWRTRVWAFRAGSGATHGQV